ncbi:MAG: hypothetical protein ACYC01_03425 [Lutibacter sp.]
MLTARKIFNKNFRIILGFLFVLILLQSCKVYQKSTNLEEASQSEEKGFVKVTMVNGDEYIYESIELIDGKYFGIKTLNGEKATTMLLKETVLKVERQNKKSSGFFGLVGITIGVASVILAVLML